MHARKPRYSSPKAHERLALLGTLPVTFVFEGYLCKLASFDPDDEQDADHAWLMIVQRERELSDMEEPHDKGCDGESLVQRLRSFDKPCHDLLTLYQSETILKPFVDLLVVSLIASTAFSSMDKFHEDPNEVPGIDNDEVAPDDVYKYAACNRFMLLGKRHLA